MISITFLVFASVLSLFLLYFCFHWCFLRFGWISRRRADSQHTDNASQLDLETQPLLNTFREEDALRQARAAAALKQYHVYLDQLESSSTQTEEDVEQQEGVTCAICLHHLKSGQVIQTLPACGHTYHVECLEAWLESGQQKVCPLCQTLIVAVGEPEVMPVILETGERTEESARLHSNIVQQVETQ